MDEGKEPSTGTVGVEPTELSELSSGSAEPFQCVRLQDDSPHCSLTISHFAYFLICESKLR